MEVNARTHVQNLWQDKEWKHSKSRQGELEEELTPAPMELMVIVYV